jgi:hypothetical protein
LQAEHAVHVAMQLRIVLQKIVDRAGVDRVGLVVAEIDAVLALDRRADAVVAVAMAPRPAVPVVLRPRQIF